MRRLDVMRTSASRPDLLKISTESLKKHLKFSGEMRVIIHEDCLNKPRSEECMKYIEKAGAFDLWTMHYPPITQILSLNWCIHHMETEYFLNWEDDFEAIRDVDLDLVCKILDENPDVNQVAFHKRAIMHNRYSFKKLQVERSGVALVTNPHWAFTPAVWRKRFVMEYWKPPYEAGTNPVWWLNPRIKQGNSIRTADWIIKNTGHYFLGQYQEPAFCEHIGAGKSLREGELKFD